MTGMLKRLAMACLLMLALTGSAWAQTDPEDPPPGEWGPWVITNPDTLEEEPDHNEVDPAYASALLGGLSPNSIRLFGGKTMRCMRALGGLLNCCTQKPPPDVEKDYWKEFMNTLREGNAGAAACQYQGPDTSQQQQGAWANIGNMPGNLALNDALTSALENLQGGGETPECKDADKNTHEQVTADFVRKQRPKMKWYCDSGEKDLAVMKKLGNCEFLGTYCSTRILGACIDRRERYCCFNSPMAKMFRKALAKQNIGKMGTAKAPNCDGITISELAKLNSNNLDTEDLEGRLYDSGVFDDLFKMEDMDELMARWTGEGSTIGNNDRQNLDDRTLDRIDDMDASGMLDAVTDEVLGTVDEEEPEENLSPGRLVLRSGVLSARRGYPFTFNVSRDGGKGAVSVMATIVDKTALLGRDISGSRTVTITWGDRDVNTKEVTLQALRSYLPTPPVTEYREFDVTLSNATGGATISTGTITIVVEPDETEDEPTTGG